jgi:hypothetical protein
MAYPTSTPVSMTDVETRDNESLIPESRAILARTLATGRRKRRDREAYG